MEEEIKLAKENLKKAIDEQDWYLCNFYQTEMSELIISKSKIDTQFEEMRRKSEENFERYKLNQKMAILGLW